MLILGSKNTSFALKCTRIQCWDYTKHNTETDTTAVRGHQIYTCATKKERKRAGHILPWKTNDHKTTRNIYNCIFGEIFIFLYSKQFKDTKYAQIIWVNRSEQRLTSDLIITWVQLRWSEPGHEDFFYQLFRTNKRVMPYYYHLSQQVHVLDTQRFLFCNCQVTTDCMEERGMERGNHSVIFLERTRDGHCQSDDRWNCFNGWST